MKTFHTNNYNWRLLFQRLWLPKKVNGLPEPVNGLPKPVNGLPEPVNGLPEPVNGLPEPVNALPEPVNGLPEPVNGLPEPVNGLPEPVKGLPEPVKGLPKPVNGLLESVHGLPKAFNVKLMTADERPQYAKLVQQTICKSKEHLQEELNKFVHNGGKDIYLRQPKSCYETGRSTTLLEVKKLHSVEAVVIGYIKRTNQTITSLRCRLASGKELSVCKGLSLTDHYNPPKIGSVIKLSCNKYSEHVKFSDFCFKGVCEGRTEEQLQEEWNQIVNPQGEGIKSTGKTKQWKVYSAEAVVIGHNEEKDYPCSSLRCRMANGIEFSCMGLTVKHRNNPPKIGSVIKFTYSATPKHHRPLYANFKGVYEDKTEASADIIEAIHES